MTTVLVIGDSFKSAMTRLEEEIYKILAEKPHLQVVKESGAIRVGGTRYIARSARFPSRLRGFRPDKIITTQEWFFSDEAVAIIKAMKEKSWRSML